MHEQPLSAVAAVLSVPADQFFNSTQRLVCSFPWERKVFSVQMKGAELCERDDISSSVVLMRAFLQ